MDERHPLNNIPTTLWKYIPKRRATLEVNSVISNSPIKDGFVFIEESD